MRTKRACVRRASATKHAALYVHSCCCRYACCYTALYVCACCYRLPYICLVFLHSDIRRALLPRLLPRTTSTSAPTSSSTASSLRAASRVSASTTRARRALSGQHSCSARTTTPSTSPTATVTRARRTVVLVPTSTTPPAIRLWQRGALIESVRGT